MDANLNTKNLIKILLTITLIALSNHSLSDIDECIKNKDSACVYRSLISRAEKDPKIDLLNVFVGSPTKFGENVELHFIMGSESMSDEEIITESNRAISLISFRHNHPQEHIHLIPYYTLQAEACTRTKNLSCINESTRHICRVLNDGDFSWSNHPLANKKGKGIDRANKIKGDCKHSPIDNKNLQNLYQKIDKMINALKSKESYDTYAHLFMTKEDIEQYKSKNLWEELIKIAIEYKSDTLKNLINARGKVPIINRHGDGYEAEFILESDSSEKGVTMSQAMRFKTINGIWFH